MVRSYLFRPNGCSVGLKEWHWFLHFWEVKRAAPVPGCVLQTSICWTALLACSSDPPNLSLAVTLSLLNRYAANHAKEKLNKCSPLCSKNNTCLKSLKYNLYLQKCTAFIIAFLPSSTSSHCCSCLNSPMELHLWQLSKRWKTAASGSTNPFCCPRYSPGHKRTCIWESLYSYLRKKREVSPVSLYPLLSRPLNGSLSLSLSLPIGVEGTWCLPDTISTLQNPDCQSCYAHWIQELEQCHTAYASIHS